MQIFFSAKQLGKKRAFIQRQSIDIEGSYEEPYPLRYILAEIVRQQVNTFNQKQETKSLVGFLKEGEIKAQSTTGKVGFGSIYNDNKAQAEKAITTVLQAFEDGIIAVFLDDQQLESLDASITLTQESCFSFIRLTFLAGSFW